VDDPNVAAELGLKRFRENQLSIQSGQELLTSAAEDSRGDKGPVDFSPVACPSQDCGGEFPTVSFKPGVLATADYSQFVQVTNAAGVDIQRAHRGLKPSTPAKSTSPMETWTYNQAADEVVASNPINSTVNPKCPQWVQLWTARLVPFQVDASILYHAGHRTQTPSPLDAADIWGRDSFSSPSERISAPRTAASRR